MTALLAMLSGLALAAPVPVTLPSGAAEAEWREPLALAGLAPGVPRDGAWVLVVAGEDDRWLLVVRRADNTVHRVPIARPQDAAAREELAVLAASLLDTVVARPAPAPAPAPAPEPRPPPSVPVVVATEAPPEPVPPPESVPAPLPEPDAPPRAWELAAGAGAFVAGGAGTGLLVSMDGGLSLEGGLLFGVSGDYLPGVELREVPGVQTLHRADLGVHLGQQGPAGLRWTTGFGASYRWIDVAGGPRSSGLLPVLRGSLQWTVALGERLRAAPTAWLTADLVQTRLVRDGGTEGTLSHFGGGLGLALRHRRALASPGERS